jgi:hypothetical protein
MRWIASATAASAALVIAYLALGGASYAPAQPADPCVARDWRDPGGFQEVAEQIVLSALDGVACELDVSREEVVLALSSRESFERFAREQGVSDDELEELARSGLVRAVDEAEEADALNPTIADLLRGLARRIPISELLDLLDLLPGGR